jgi:hypothetical protein
MVAVNSNGGEGGGGLGITTPSASTNLRVTRQDWNGCSGVAMQVAFKRIVWLRASPRGSWAVGWHFATAPAWS